MSEIATISKQCFKKVFKMIIGNMQFKGVNLFGTLLVQSAICLETGVQYNTEDARKYFHLYMGIK